MNDRPPTYKCPACGGALIQKSGHRLLVTGGLFLLLAVVIGWRFHFLLIPGALLGLTGLYLLVWALRGKARWCRHCKAFPRG
jgi:Flp pilus assembly protein TadB